MELFVIGAVVVVALGLVVWAIAIYNGLVALRNRYKNAYAQIIADRPDSEFYKTFFSSVTRRNFDTVGVDPLVEFLAEEEQRHTPHIDAPHFRFHVTPGEWDLDDEPGVGCTYIWGVDDVVAFGLTTVLDHLPEDPLPVEETDSGERRPQVAGALQMVSSEHTETTGVLGEVRAQPELR